MSSAAARPWEWEDLALEEPPENYFELFDLPVSFAVDARRLAERYRDLQAAAHPDRFGASPEVAQAVPRRAPGQVSEAYRTLKDPQERARYLLTLHTGESGPEGASIPDGSSLLEEMELQESLSEAQSSPNPRAALARVLTQLAERSLALDKALEPLFADPSTENLEMVRAILRKLDLLERCRRDAEALDSWLDAGP